MLNFCRGTSIKRPLEKMPFYVIVNDALSEQHFGNISCIPAPIFKTPATVEWTVDGRAVSSEEIGLDGSGCCASRVPPHVNCSITMTDATGQSDTVGARVGVLDVPTVSRYDCTPASGATARDGAVTAVVDRAPAKCLYLWTSGVVTSEAELRNCMPGLYTVVLMTMDHGCIHQLHTSAPAVVSVVPR